MYRKASSDNYSRWRGMWNQSDGNSRGSQLHFALKLLSAWLRRNSPHEIAQSVIKKPHYLVRAMKSSALPPSTFQDVELVTEVWINKATGNSREIHKSTTKPSCCRDFWFSQTRSQPDRDWSRLSLVSSGAWQHFPQSSSSRYPLCICMSDIIAQPRSGSVEIT